MLLNINAKNVIKFSNTLEKISKSALPVAIRTALNSAAFDVKQNTMPQKAAATFVQRSRNFFKANSKVQKAEGFDINKMKATVGFVPDKLVDASTNFAVKDLEQQEQSGTIKGKTFIPTIFARRGNSRKGLVKPNFRLKEIKRNIVDASKMDGKNDRQKYLLAAKTAGVGGFVLYKNMLWQINSFTKKGDIKRTPIYSVKRGRSVSVKSTGFMKKASLESNKKLEGFYADQAIKQIAKLK